MKAIRILAAALALAFVFFVIGCIVGYNDAVPADPRPRIEHALETGFIFVLLSLFFDPFLYFVWIADREKAAKKRRDAPNTAPFTKHLNGNDRNA